MACDSLDINLILTYSFWWYFIKVYVNNEHHDCCQQTDYLLMITIKSINRSGLVRIYGSVESSVESLRINWFNSTYHRLLFLFYTHYQGFPQIEQSRVVKLLIRRQHQGIFIIFQPHQRHAVPLYYPLGKALHYDNTCSKF